MASGKQEDITIKYTIRNTVAEPMFKYEQKVTSKAGQPFIRFMEQAAENDKNFQFSATCYGKMGYFIEKLGGKESVTGLSYWQFKKAPSTVLGVGNSLTYHNEMKFSTKDQDNDRFSGYNYATSHHGAWWYKYCHRSNLNGEYANSNVINSKYAVWYHWKRIFEALQKTVLMIKA
ncbi:ficolin-1-like [Saccostrea echinata]|uniref:ficolin-1-like n=1 Tax=Saccostrea echinata TaxID=191078 RepID=UPI002A840122|nr:ficolin-1-like [Saccostrea echinata]